ncbi:MAG: NADH-quinone oxidoreductase subunit J [Candidatus Puniceispirillaceae bacterium]
MLSSVFFYLFATICCLAGLMVVSSRNPVHSVLFLILAFFNAAGLFILLNAEFLAMLLVVVYVGAVAVLFLFVVMMLDINYSELREGFQKYRSLGLFIAAVLLVELFATFFEYTGNVKTLPSPGAVHNTKALGQVIYTDYIYLFQLAGLILLVAMVGAITLTLRRRSGVRTQVIADQNSRTREETVKLAKVVTGAGVKEVTK